MNKFLSTGLSLLQMARPVTGFIAVLGAVIAYWSSTTEPSFAVGCFLALALFCITSAGFVINDYFDIEKDRVNEPWRALPAGRITKRDTFFGACFLFSVGLIAASQLGFYAFCLALFNTALLFAYSKLLRINGTFCNLISAYLTASLIAFGGLAGGAVLHLWAAIAFVFFYSLSRELVFDIQDLRGDRQAGVSSLAIHKGKSFAFSVAWLMVVLALLAWLGAASLTQMGVRAQPFTLVSISLILMCIGLYRYQVQPNRFSYVRYVSLTRWGFLIAMPAIYLAR